MDSWIFYFYLAFYVILVLAGAIYLVYLIAKRNRDKLEEIRKDWTNKLHQDIGVDLSTIMLRLETLRRKLDPQNSKANNDLTEIYKMLQETQKNLRFAQGLIDTRKNSLIEVLLDITTFATNNANANNIDLKVSNTLPESFGEKIDILRINKLYLSLKEVLGNCFKYANATTIWLDILPSKNGIQFEIKDNGIGFDSNKEYSGLGLKNLKQYSQEGAISIQFDSTIGKGTIVKLFLAL